MERKDMILLFTNIMQDSETFVLLQPKAFTHNYAFYDHGHASVGAIC